MRVYGVTIMWVSTAGLITATATRFFDEECDREMFIKENGKEGVRYRLFNKTIEDI